MRLRFILTGFLLAFIAPIAVFAAEQSFTDVPPTHPSFAAAEYLKSQAILQGYADGTFRPDQPVNRAEVMKVIVLQKLSADDLLTASGAVSSFVDVSEDAWYFPYVEEALTTLHIIDGPPNTKHFAPERAVNRAEFLKMLMLAYGIDSVGSYSELTYPIAEDVADSSAWFYPSMRYAFTASMLVPKDGALEPAKELTRADIADMLYRFLLYREGKRTQTLLSMMENETLTTLRLIDVSALRSAEESAARAILAARGALSAQPDNATVKGSVKTAESAMALVQSARSSAEGDASKALEYASTAWHLGSKAKEFSSSLNALADQLQKTASEMADAARGGQ